MTLATKAFGPYRAEIEPNDDRPGNQCWVVDLASGDCSSLAWLDGEGEFDSGRKGPSREILDAIEAWAATQDA